MHGKIVVLLALSSLSLAAACGGTTEEPAPQEQVSGKADETSDDNSSAMTSRAFLELGEGLPVEIDPIGDGYVVADSDCSDGCLHLLGTDAEDLVSLGTHTAESGSRAVTVSAVPANDAVILATESSLEVIDVADGTLSLRQVIELPSEPHDIFVGARIILVARGEAGLDVYRLDLSKEEPAAAIVTGVTAEHSWTQQDAEGNYTDHTATYAPVELTLTADQDIIARNADGTLFRSAIPLPDLNIDFAGQNDSSVSSIQSTRFGVSLAAGGASGLVLLDTNSQREEGRHAAEGIADLNRLVLLNLGNYVAIGSSGIALLTLDTSSAGAGDISVTPQWRPLVEFDGATDAHWLQEDRSMLVTGPGGVEWLALR